MPTCLPRSQAASLPPFSACLQAFKASALDIVREYFDSGAPSEPHLLERLGRRQQEPHPHCLLLLGAQCCNVATVPSVGCHPASDASEVAQRLAAHAYFSMPPLPTFVTSFMLFLCRRCQRGGAAPG